MNWKNELIRFYEGDQLNGMIDKLCPDKRFRDDLKQELIVYLLEMEESKLEGLIQRKQLLYYCYGYLKNQYQSSTSEFYKKYRNDIVIGDEIYFDKIDEAEIDDHFERVEKILVDKINWFDAFLFRSYYYNWWSEVDEKTISGRSYRKIEKEYTLSDDFKIDHSYIYNRVKKTMKVIKKELKK